MYYTAQLFCTAAQDSGSFSGHTRTQNKDMKQGKLTIEQMRSVSNDIKENWDSTYSSSKFPPSKAFDGEVIDRGSNRHLRDESFREIAEMNALITEFERTNKQLTVRSVWIIKKTKENAGFQGWHRDFYLQTSGIIATIVINVGVYASDDD